MNSQPYIFFILLLISGAWAQPAWSEASSPLPRYETKPLTAEDRAEVTPFQTPDNWGEKVGKTAKSSFVRLSNDRGHWQAVKGFMDDSVLSETVFSNRMAALSQDPYSLKNNSFEIKNQITSQYSKNTTDQFKDIPILQKYKSGFQYQLNFTSENKTQTATSKPGKYGLLIDDITPVKAPDLATLGDPDRQSNSRPAKVHYTIGPVDEHELSINHVDEEMNAENDQQPNFFQNNFKAPSPNMKFDFLPGNTGGIPGLSGSKLSLTQVEGLFRNEFITANGDTPQKTTQQVKVPIIRSLYIMENYEDIKLHTQTTYGGLLVYETLPNLSVTKNHVEDRWRSDVAWTKNIHSIKGAIEMPPTWKPGDKTNQEGERYTVEYSRPL